MKKKKKSSRPPIPRSVQAHLWLRAGGRCEFRGCNKILYEDNVTKDPINESNIAHIISWTKDGPRGNEELSPKNATEISNLMLLCPEHNHLIDKKENLDKYTITVLEEMKREHEGRIKALLSIMQQPKRIIELKSIIHGQRPAISFKEEADALFPYYPAEGSIVIDLCDIDSIEGAKTIIDCKVNKYITEAKDDLAYGVFIMALIPYGCYLGYAMGNKVNAQAFQHFRDTEDWKWKNSGGGFVVEHPLIENGPQSDVKLFINISGKIDCGLTKGDFPAYSISADEPGFSFLQSWNQVEEFRGLYRATLDKIRNDHGEGVNIHLYPATPNPINFQIGKSIMKNVDPTIILYDKSDTTTDYVEVMHLHDRVRKKKVNS